jgi:putative hemolysin
MTLPLPLPLTLLLLFLLTFASFFLAASETAVVGLSKIRLRHLVNKGIKRALSLQRLVTKLDKFITATLIGNNFVNISISAIITAIFVSFMGYRWGVIISTLTVTLFVLIFCEITPKILAIKHSEKLALFSAPFMEALINIFSPIIRIFIGTSNAILRLFGLTPVKRSPLINEEELRLLIEIGKEEGVLTEEERKLLHRIFEFGDTKVRDVMVSKDKMVAIDIKATPDSLLDLTAEKGHARIPVFKDSVDNMVGIIYVRDLLYILRDNRLFVLEDIVYPAYFVLPTVRVCELLKDFQLKRIQIAVVVDENRKTLGLVTLEDLIEEIVGEIEEEIKK